MTVHYQTVEVEGRMVGLSAAYVARRVENIETAVMDALCLQEVEPTSDRAEFDRQSKCILEEGDQTTYYTPSMGFAQIEVRVPKEGPVMVGLYSPNKKGDNEWTMQMILQMGPIGLSLGMFGIDPIHSEREELPDDLFYDGKK